MKYMIVLFVPVFVFLDWQSFGKFNPHASTFSQQPVFFNESIENPDTNRGREPRGRDESLRGEKRIMTLFLPPFAFFLLIIFPVIPLPLHQQFHLLSTIQ